MSEVEREVAARVRVVQVVVVHVVQQLLRPVNLEGKSTTKVNLERKSSRHERQLGVRVKCGNAWCKSWWHTLFSSFCDLQSQFGEKVNYRGASLSRKRIPLGPYRRPMPSVPGGF